MVFKFLLWVEEGLPWLRWFVDVLLKLWPGLILSSFQVGFVVEVALPSYTVNYTAFPYSELHTRTAGQNMLP